MLDVSGMQEAIKELQMNKETQEIRSLCTLSVSEVKVICFPRAQCLLSFAENFHVMNVNNNSDIFFSLWSSTMKKAHADNPGMSITNIEKDVWMPTLHRCQNMLEQLHGKSMTLTDVDTYFQDYRKRGLERELKQLFKGVNQCCRKSPSGDWIFHTVHLIESYWKLCNSCEAANCFLELRNVLKLTKGDFSALDIISTKVGIG